MHRTRFAGLTAPDPDDAALQVDGGSFANRNPDITDFFLSIGAVTHRHDEHLPLASPTHAPSAVVLASGGSIESGTDLYFGWTASDSYGGETILSPPTLVSTTEPAPDPSGVLSGTRAYSGRPSRSSATPASRAAACSSTGSPATS
jgi:hypothetical protein